VIDFDFDFEAIRLFDLNVGADLDNDGVFLYFFVRLFVLLRKYAECFGIFM